MVLSDLYPELDQKGREVTQKCNIWKGGGVCTVQDSQKSSTESTHLLFTVDE